MRWRLHCEDVEVNDNSLAMVFAGQRSHSRYSRIFFCYQGLIYELSLGQIGITAAMY